MPIESDHTLVSSHHKLASAKMLAELLGVPWAESGAGTSRRSLSITVSRSISSRRLVDPFPIYHFCFRVRQLEFDAILARLHAAGIAYRSSVRGPMDGQVNTDFGSNMIYWN